VGNNNYSRRRFIAGLAASTALASPAFAQTSLPPCQSDRATITGGFGKAIFSVDVAATDASRAQGLMNVANMPLSKGMLFVYDKPQRMSFWMRNTLIELDMLFVDGFGVIRHIHHLAQPLDETVISPGDMLLMGALEINGGLAKRMGIGVGDVLRHPAFVSLETPWNCSE
jgi:uncharacterized membrane protein (UPF0127 family)